MDGTPQHYGAPVREHSAAAWEAISAVRNTSPLIHCITNYVSMDLAANVLLAAKASPAMVHAIEEVAEFVGIASALCINVGTLDARWVDSMKAAATAANQKGKPWVLDPVGAGATKFRTQACLDLIALKPTVIRGNASEILALTGASGSTRGVDSTHSSSDAVDAAKELARSAGCVVAVSGKMDVITDGTKVLRCFNGHALLQRVTATGCALSAVIAAFLASGSAPGFLEATAYAFVYFGLAGEMAASDVQGPGTFRVALLDALYNLDQDFVVTNAHVTEDGQHRPSYVMPQ